MRAKRMLVVQLISMILLAGCSSDAPIAVYTSAVPASLKQSEERGYATEKGQYFRDNVVTYTRSEGNKSILIYSAPIEKSENALKETDREKEQYLAAGSYVRKQLPEIWSDDAYIRIGNSQNYVNLFPAKSTAPFPGRK